MAFVSTTRLRLRSMWFLPRFALATRRSQRQACAASGYIDGSLLADRKLTFWTMTLWREAADMRGYMTTGAHRDAMPRLFDWCDEASVAHWEQAEAALPTWREAERRMRADGRASKVRQPSADHAALTFAPARTSRSVPLRRR